jgi:elongation factor Ts
MHDCALHGAAFKPQYLAPANVAPDYIAKQTEIFLAQVAEDKKPEDVKKKIVEGKVKKHLADICFVEQGFVKEDKKSVAQMAAEIGKAAGGTVELVDYRVYRAGEAL